MLKKPTHIGQWFIKHCAFIQQVGHEPWHSMFVACSQMMSKYNFSFKSPALFCFHVALLLGSCHQLQYFFISSTMISFLLTQFIFNPNISQLKKKEKQLLVSSPPYYFGLLISWAWGWKYTTFTFIYRASCSLWVVGGMKNADRRLSTAWDERVRPMVSSMR